MVESLAEKLKDEPENIEGWLRLVRSYVVLNRRPDAEAALKDARKALSGKTDALKRLADLAGSLGLDAGVNK